MASDRIDWEWLIRIRLGECTPDERAEFERWVQEDPSRASLVNALGALDGTDSKDLGHWDTERSLTRFKQRRSGAPRRPSAAHLTLARPARRSGWLPWRLSGLAVVALVLAIIGLRGEKNPRAAAQPRTSSAPRETVTGPG